MSGAAALTPCARCAAVQRTCCQRAEILVTEGDVARIAAHVVRRDFFEHRRPEDSSYVDEDPEDPNWRRLTVRGDGTRRMLVKQRNGDCWFLGATGCTLPLDVRPLVCRLYPFAFHESGITGEDPDYCPTKMLAPRGERMTDVLGMRLAAAQSWRAQLYRELHHGQP